ncbi:MAG: hypothetical protein JKY65_33295 [Planctomycetes bacterium]|nr:hypothetical protein [Planctomycetota bacterium]
MQSSPLKWPALVVGMVLAFHAFLWTCAPRLPEASGFEFWQVALEKPAHRAENSEQRVVTLRPVGGDYYLVRGRRSQRKRRPLERMPAAAVERGRGQILAHAPGRREHSLVSVPDLSKRRVGPSARRRGGRIDVERLRP